ncbi:platelet-activating factor acetylhydrolase IB subunit alpha2-like [Lytechinus variegatus]|uniref:platelet-activating factor acetylhydrolase IB subunit alpha2-like n=1 Tax=Lytechinus variegatus TaxID=7654 RepID=UPI001BB2CB6B|nr:platelet-activating factor acetylhydrolase IB subunit alpha2-like [Lytechinus variegatus]
MMDQPADVACPVEDVQGDGRWKSLHKHYVHLTGEREPEVLFVGDSLIQHLGQSEVWKMFERYHCLNFGVGGDQTQHVLWRLENGELQNIQPKAIVLLVGTNNHGHTAEEVTKGIEAIVKLIVDKQPQAHIIVMAIPPRGHRHNKLRDKNSAINAALATSLPKLGKAELLESAKSLLSSEGLIFTSDMFDFLHFTNQGYKKLCEPLQDRLEEILSE